MANRFNPRPRPIIPGTDILSGLQHLLIVTPARIQANFREVQPTLEVVNQETKVEWHSKRANGVETLQRK